MDKSLAALRKDPRFAPLIKKYGPPTLKRDAGYFQALVRSILHQQVSGASAAAIMKRFVALFTLGKKPTSEEVPHPFPTPNQVNAKSIDELRTAGLSGQKAAYIKDLALKFTDGTIRQIDLDSMSTEDITEHLVQVKGIGVWTVHMFLIFTLGHLDVLPVGDLGVRKGFQIIYNMRQLPTPAQMEKRANAKSASGPSGWRPHASVVSWYLWRVADEAKVPKTKINKSVRKSK